MSVLSIVYLSLCCLSPPNSIHIGISPILFIPVFIFGFHTSSLSFSFVIYLYFHPCSKSLACPLLPFSVLFSLSEYFFCLVPTHKQHLRPAFFLFFLLSNSLSFSFLSQCLSSDPKWMAAVCHKVINKLSE